jgi:hypothetical protein
MKILDDICMHATWIGIPFRFNWIQIKLPNWIQIIFKFIWKKWETNCCIRCWKSARDYSVGTNKTLEKHKFKKTPFDSSFELSKEQLM